MSSSPCDPLLASLKACLLRSDCVLKQNIAPSVCLRDHTNELPEECQHLRKALFECKRGLLDMRKRFRGNTAAQMGRNFEGEHPQDDAKSYRS